MINCCVSVAKTSILRGTISLHATHGGVGAAALLLPGLSHILNQQFQHTLGSVGVLSFLHKARPLHSSRLYARYMNLFFCFFLVTDSHLFASPSLPLLL